MRSVLLVVMVVIAIVVLDRLLLAAERRGWIYYRRSRGRSGSTASAFLEIQSMLEPSRKHVIEARQEKEEDDDAGDPPEPQRSDAGPIRARTRAMDQLLQQYSTPVEGGGVTYRARAIAVARDDGMWEGYFEFDPVDGGALLRTERETTQPSRDALAYWATGIEPTYLAGALERALRRTG
jgi:hypothetical protein